jgi:hypothetical protein
MHFNTSWWGGQDRSQACKKLWKLEVPGKIKILGWRALHGFIPCRDILANRHIANAGGCPMQQRI